MTRATTTWTGDLAPGATVTITFSVTVDNTATGDLRLVNTAVSAAAGSNCPAGSTDPACTVAVTVLTPALTITKTAAVSTTTPGSTVGYTITVADTGQTPYSGASVTDSLAGVLDDATYNDDATATGGGSVTFASPVLTWTGSLAVGDTATIRYSVTVNNPDTGSKLLSNTVVSAAAGSDCPAGSSRPECTATVPVNSGTLSISVPGTAFLGATTPGGAISAGLGDIRVTDNRGFGASWTATVSATDFTTGTATAAETITAASATYDIGAFSQTAGSATFTRIPITNLDASAQPVVAATNVGGENSATWNPVIGIPIPAGAPAGPYTAVITHSVS